MSNSHPQQATASRRHFRAQSTRSGHRGRWRAATTPSATVGNHGVQMYKDGTLIEAEAGCGAHSIRGRQVGDHESLDDVLTVFDLDNGDTILINGWLWSIEVVLDPAE